MMEPENYDSGICLQDAKNITDFRSPYPESEKTLEQIKNQK